MRFSSRHVRFLGSLLGVVLISIPSVLGNVFENVLRPFRGTDFGFLYQSYAPFIDGILYFIIFFGLSKFVFRDKFKSGGKMLSVGVSLALSFAAAFFSSQTGFYLGKIGPIALIIVFMMVFFFLYRTMKQFGNKKWLAFSIAFLLMMIVVREALGDQLAENSTLSLLLSIGWIAAILGIIFGLYELFKGKGSSNSTTSSATNDPQQAAKEAKKEAAKEAQNSAKQELKMQDAEKQIEDLQGNLNRLEQNINIETGQEVEAYKRIHEILKQYLTVIQAYLLPTYNKVNSLRQQITGFIKSRSGPTDPAMLQQYREKIAQGEQYIAQSRNYIEQGLKNLLPKLQQLHEAFVEQDNQSNTLLRVEKQMEVANELLEVTKANMTTGFFHFLKQAKILLDGMYRRYNKYAAVAPGLALGGLNKGWQKVNKAPKEERIKVIDTLATYMNQAQMAIRRLEEEQRNINAHRKEVGERTRKLHEIIITEHKLVRKQKKMSERLESYAKKILDEFKRPFDIHSAEIIADKLSDIVNNTNIMGRRLYDMTKLEEELQEIKKLNLRVAEYRKQSEAHYDELRKWINKFEKSVTKALLDAHQISQQNANALKADPLISKTALPPQP